MFAQVAPFVLEGDYFNLATYRALGITGTIFALTLLVLGFSIAKGHIRVASCGPNEGGIREFFGRTLWKCGPGPHLHIGGIFAFRKISFADREVVLTGEVERRGTFYRYDIMAILYVLGTKEAIRERVYRAEDTNRDDVENGAALKQVGALLQSRLKSLLADGTDEAELEEAVRIVWGEDSVPPYGYAIRSIEVRELVQRPTSEMADAIKLGGYAPSVALLGEAAHSEVHGNSTSAVVYGQFGN